MSAKKFKKIITSAPHKPAKSPAISIIVPVYKVEKYLRQCVDSILAQTFKDLEIILVDDGSPDRCPQICDEYAAQDRRVKVIHQPNGGLGKAYNTGLAAAQGEYIGLIESDDWIEPTMYEKLYQQAVCAQADLVKCDFWKYNSFNSPADEPYYQNLRIELSEMAPEGTTLTIDKCPLLLIRHPSIWAALYHRSFIKPLKFMETPGASFQDFSFGMEALCRAQRLRIIHDRLLHYRIEPHQASSGSHTGKALLAIGHQISHAYEKTSCLPVFSAVADTFYFHSLCIACDYFYKIKPHLRREFLQIIHRACSSLLNMPESVLHLLTPRQKALALAFAHGDTETAMSLLYDTKEIRIFSFPIYRRQKNPYERRIYLFSMLVYRRMNIPFCTQYYFLGLPLWKKRQKN